MNNLFFKKNTYTNVTLRPFNYIIPSVGNTNITILILLIPQIIMLLVTRSFDSLLVVMTALIGSLAAETLYVLCLKSHKSFWIPACIQGIVIGLLLPSTYPPVAVFFITFFSLLLTKYAFGGYVNSWANPVAVTVAIAYFINSAAFPQYLVTTADLQSRNAALVLIQNGTVPVISTDSAITGFLNKTIFKLAGMAIPDGYVSLFWDCHSIIPAFRFNMVTLISSIILISLDMVEIIVPACFIVIYTLLVRFMGPVVVHGIPGQGDILLALLSSGTLFSTLYLLQWYGTTPLTIWGKVTYGCVAGIIAFLVIGCGTSSAGYVFTVLIMNILSPMIQVFESKQVKHKIEKTIVPRLRAMQEVDNA
jgi:electron transport complex protein RnfD